jgi:beta-D-xylosidase 4
MPTMPSTRSGKSSVGCLALLLGAAGALTQDTFPDCSQAPLSQNAVCDISLDAVSRAKALVAALTFEEKVNNTQNGAPGVPRLGIPPYNWWNEGLHGVANSPGVSFAGSGEFSYATSFPGPILMSAAFDDALIKRVATVVSTEARAFSNVARAGLDYWTPNINPFKDPRWGRGQETPGEDPFHVGRYVYNLIDGLQNGIGPANPKVVATCKHFAAYDLEDWEGNTRFEFNAVVSSQDLSEYYLPPFKSCARDAKVDAVMCSYNAVNGIPSCADSYLLETILREHWEWNDPGKWITSDCDAIQNVYTDHHYAQNGSQAAAESLIAGTDLDCGKTYPTYLGPAAAEGLFQNSTLDTALVRLYSSLVKLGYFDPAASQSYRSIGWADVATPQSTDLALTAAVEGIVLLKNDQENVIPIKKKGQTIALIGPYANATTQFQGNYQGQAQSISTLISAAEALGYNVLFEYGTTINSTSTAGFTDALSAANAADFIIYAGGIDNSIEAESMDRNTIVWPGNQLQLINDLSQIQKPFVVLQFGGGQVDDSTLLSNTGVNALLWGGYPSQAAGTAVFQILTGKTAPAGRLPVTQYPSNYVNEVPMTDMSLRPGTANPGRTYRWYNDAVIPFGYGLHYTTFDVSWPNKKLGPYNIGDLVHTASTSSFADSALFDTFTVKVTNKGKVTSDYVALLFLTTTNAGPAPYPIKTLVGYTRVSGIAPGASKNAKIDVTLGSLARTDNNGNLVLYPGSYSLEVDVGNQTSQAATFKVNGQAAVLDQFPQPS